MVLTEDSCQLCLLEPKEQDVCTHLYTCPLSAGWIQELQVDLDPPTPVKMWAPLGDSSTDHRNSAAALRVETVCREEGNRVE